MFKWFDKSSLFNMFPHVEAFLRVFRLTGQTMTAAPVSPVNNIIRSFPSSNPLLANRQTNILEEIAEVTEELEQKRGKYRIHSKLG